MFRRVGGIDRSRPRLSERASKRREMSKMKIHRAGVGVVAAVGLGLWSLAAAPAAFAQVKLEYKFPEGQTLTYKTTMKVNQTMTIMGMELPTESDQTIITSRAIGKRAGDSGLPVREKVESFRTELTLPGGLQISYDSKDPNAKIDNEQLKFLEDVFKLAAETNYTVVLDGKNKVKAVEGTEKLLERADKLNELVRGSIRSQFQPDKLKAKFEQSHANLPDVLARQGEPWERTESMEAGGEQEMVVRKKYEYAGTEKKGDKTLDKITAKVTEVKLSDNPNSQSPAKVTKSDLKVESSDETILFDREAGRVAEARGKLRVKGTMTLSAMGQELPGELDFTIESNTELQPAAK
jgi:hypothetical protein